MLFPFYDTDNAELIVTHIDTPQNSQLHNADQCIQTHKSEQVEGKSSDFDIFFFFFFLYFFY